MSAGLQCCVRCHALEQGATGTANRYICRACHLGGWYVDGAGNIRQGSNVTVDPQRPDSA